MTTKEFREKKKEEEKDRKENSKVYRKQLR